MKQVRRRLHAGKAEWGFLFSGLLAALVVSSFWPGVHAAGLLGGYALGLVSVSLHLYWNSFILDRDVSEFLLLYYVGTLVRFMVTLGLFTALILIIEEGQISFTLSFIISYIFHSVIDGILTNKIVTEKTHSDNR